MIGDHYRFYNTTHPRHRTPCDEFTSIPFEEPETDVIESLTTGIVDTAGR
jgi:hypothetical protein